MTRGEGKRKNQESSLIETKKEESFIKGVDINCRLQEIKLKVVNRL